MAAPKPNESITNVGSIQTNLTLLAGFVFKLLGCLFIFCSSFHNLLYNDVAFSSGDRTLESTRTALGCNKHIVCNYLRDFWRRCWTHFSLKTQGFRCEAMIQATTRPSLICHDHIMSPFFQKENTLHQPVFICNPRLPVVNSTWITNWRLCCPFVGLL